MSTPAIAPITVSDAILPSPSDPPKFNNPIASVIWDAGFPGRAKRIERCGAYRSRKCEDGHVTREHRFCGTRTCNGQRCAYKAAADLVERYQTDADHAIMNSKKGHYAPRFTFVDYRFRCAPNRESVSTLVSGVIKLMMKHEHLTREDMRPDSLNYQGQRRYPHTLWTYAAGFDDDGLLIFRMLFLDANIDPDVLRTEFGAVSAAVHCVPMKSIHRFLPMLFAVAIPATDAGKAAMELAFIGIRRIRTIGQIEQPDMEELLVEEGDGKTSTNNSEIESAKSEDDLPPKLHKSCPICHKKIVEESGWMPKHLPPPMPDKITYYPASD